MSPFAGISRRALVAVTALAALSPKAQAASNPQVFVVATLSDPQIQDLNRFELMANAALNHPKSERTGAFSRLVSISTRASADQARKQIVSQVKDGAVEHLENNDVTVAKDRVAVVLL